MVRIQRVLALSPLKIAGWYMLFGGSWILLSDRLVALVAETQGQVSNLQTVKGWLFILVSGALLFALTATRERQIERSRDRLLTVTQKLQVLNRVFRHNIRNDLNVILGSVDLLRETTGDDDERELLATVAETANGLLRMSEKLRIVERANVQSTDDESVDLVALVEHECDRVQSLCSGVTIDMEVPQQAMIRGEQTVAAAVREILENAMKHHPEPPEQRRIAVTIDRSWTTVTVEIGDDGSGIPDGELQAIQTGEETQLAHASGVGLWLVTWVCRLNGGTAQFASDPNGGTTVTLAFQRVPPLERLA